jgi:putative transposase
LFIKSHKIRLLPTKAQESELKKAAGAARFAYNWALAEWNEQYAEGLKPNENKLSVKFNSIKREQFPWILQVSKCVPVKAIKNLGRAYSNYFAGLKSKRNVGKPSFKKKGVAKDSFYIGNENPQIKGNRFVLPVSKIAIKMACLPRFKGRILSYTVSRDVDRWYVAVQMETEDRLKRIADNEAVGVDLGIKTLATTSDGVVYENPRHLKKAEKRLKRYQRVHSKKKKGSQNKAKSRLKLARAHRKVRLARKSNWHHISKHLATMYTKVVIEDLAAGNMMKNHCLAKAIADCGFFTFRQQLEYKCKETGTELVVADRFYPSSKTCSQCGAVKKDLSLKDRTYECLHCGMSLDRDLNAAINLSRVGTCCPDFKSVEKTEALGKPRRSSKKQKVLAQS